MNYKYIHLFIAYNGKGLFYNSMLEVLNDSSNGFCVDDQLFVVFSHSLYGVLRGLGHSNIVLFGESNSSVDAINYYGDKCDWLFVHGMTSIIDSFKIKRRYRGKIIWRTWGHDVGYTYKKNIIKNIPKFFLNTAYRRVVRSFYAVGISQNPIDKINIEKRFGKVRTFYISYDSLTNIETLNQVISEPDIKDEHFNIMVGHSGNEYNNHLQLLNRLERFSKENIRVFLLLSYGDINYIDSVKSQINYKVWGNKITIVDKVVSYGDYVRFLKRMDLAILDITGSAALGNIGLLRMLGKKMCVNKDGLLHFYLTQTGITHLTTDELSTITYKQLCEPTSYTDEQKGYLRNPVDLWKELYLSLPDR